MMQGLLWNYLPEDRKREMLALLLRQQASLFPQPVRYPNPQQPISTTGIRG